MGLEGSLATPLGVAILFPTHARQSTASKISPTAFSPRRTS